MLLMFICCCFRGIFRYRHLMLNMVSLLPHCKKDNKVESKETKGATLNELVELKNCSSCLFFEVRDHHMFVVICLVLILQLFRVASSVNRVMVIVLIILFGTVIYASEAVQFLLNNLKCCIY